MSPSLFVKFQNYTIRKEVIRMDTSGMSQEELDLWSNINNPNNDANMDDWADAHNPNNDDYLGDDADDE